MSFVTSGDFSRQHCLRAHHMTGANKRAGEIKIEEEYRGDVDRGFIDDRVSVTM